MITTTKNQYFVNLNLSLKVESLEQLDSLQSFLADHSVSIDDLNLTLVDNSSLTAKVVDMADIEVNEWESI